MYKSNQYFECICFTGNYILMCNVYSDMWKFLQNWKNMNEDWLKKNQNRNVIQIFYKCWHVLQLIRIVVWHFRNMASVSNIEKKCRTPLYFLKVVLGVGVYFHLFIIFFQNRWAYFNQTWHKVSFGEGLAISFKWRTMHSL